ncbi:MAG: FAD-dependent thymidylate synthase [Candidatus Omnitrophica bacterium]|nr:FAD-dependent thymidylate synthase [Candidatus Omnitrophota bacterium]MBD3269192.1 FAD-dependent thymidylate synthase [Candidatus Omnitrophota bacterium]
MQVHLISYTQNPRKVIYSAARQCYSRFSAYRIYSEKKKISSVKLKDFLRHLIRRGHLSPFEHVSFTFALEGISRVCTHQLVRHRIASYSQQSQRYVSMDDFEFVIPPTIAKNKRAKKIYLETVDNIRNAHEELKSILKDSPGLDREKVNQDLRFILPQGSQTKIVVTMNTRELLHFFSERLCLRAQWEIRSVASRMFSACRKVLPEVFSQAGAKCKVLKFCPEDKKNCPLYPKKAKS